MVRGRGRAAHEYGNGLDTPDASSRAADLEGYAVRVGKYLADSTSVELSVESVATEGVATDRVCLPVSSCATQYPVATFTDAETKDVRLSVLHVGDIGRLGYAVSGSATSRDFESNVRSHVSPPEDTGIGGIRALSVPVPLPFSGPFGNLDDGLLPRSDGMYSMACGAVPDAATRRPARLFAVGRRFVP